MLSFVKTVVNSCATVTFFCGCRVRQGPAAAPRWSRCENRPTHLSAVRTQSPNRSWSQTPANERGTAATRTTPRLATAPGKRRSSYRGYLIDKRTNSSALYMCSNELLSHFVTSSFCVSINRLFRVMYRITTFRSTTDRI